MRPAAVFLAHALVLVTAASATATDPLAERLALLQPARERLLSRFAEAGVAYPPREVALAALKRERRLEVHARSASGPWQAVTAYAITGLGAVEGPKVREGDRRTPEGVYRITHLNPGSRFHLSLLLDYPNAADRAWAAAAGRSDLGGDIVIHGGSASVGCVAVGDAAVEELFVLAADIGMRQLQVIIAPWDFRVRPPAPADGGTQGDWIRTRYAQVATQLSGLPLPARPDLADVSAPLLPTWAGTGVPKRPMGDYEVAKKEVVARQARLGRAFRDAGAATERSALVAQARLFLEDVIARQLLPAWTGTPWDYNGTSQQPGVGSIACGYFVTTVLRDAGFRIDRAGLARLPAEQLIRSVCESTDVTRFSDAPAPEFVAAVQRQGTGLFLVGLDYHVGFLVNDGRELRFVHSTVVGSGEVVDEPALVSIPLVHSRYRVVGRLLGDRSVKAWLEAS